ncbi:MAG: hypothetical protein SGJ20_14040 [Planctomycetota bacterium]|nr:hypothetical protein [Planctomycetota bacterium]
MAYGFKETSIASKHAIELQTRVSMPTIVDCPQCHARLQAPEAAIGKTLTCPKCKSSFIVARPDSPEEIFTAFQPPPTSQANTSRKRCPFCAEEIAAEAIKCRHCGSMLVPVPMTNQQGTSKQISSSSPPKDPLLMALLSGCCIAGLGQMIMGQVTKGVVLLIGAMALAGLTFGVSIFITWPLMGVDAYLVAKKLKSGQSVTEWECFPS